MPRREDERHLNIAGKHPEACTCKECTDKFLKKRGINTNKLPKGKARVEDKVKRHPRDCSCASCNLLKSVDFVPLDGRDKPSFFKRLFGKG